MLEELHVRELALVRDAWLEFSPGMTVITGETGAGKTALLGGLKLLLGERADSTAVRSGAAEALVEGRFSQSHADELVVARRLTADGRSRCTIDGSMATVGGLAEAVGPLVDLHGQHEHQSLLSPSTHVGYLDRFAGPAAAEALERYTVDRGKYRESQVELSGLERALEDGRRDIETLRFTIAEIDAVAPVPDEDEKLESALPAVRHAERLAESATDAVRALRGDSGAADMVAQAVSAIAKVEGIDPRLDQLAARLVELQIVADDLGVAVREYRDGVEHDPAKLESMMQRLSALSGLKRKYGPTLAEVFAERERAQRALEVVDDADTALAEAVASRDVARARLAASAGVLEAVRSAAAPRFCDELARVAAELAMGGAKFDVSFSELDFADWGPDGPHRVEFLYAAGPGQRGRPLAKIASGGELSRVMLALKSVLGSADTVETLVFDEVDAGIGGQTATAVGKRLAELAQDHQVIVVTHLAQVAVFADRHLVVAKVIDAESVSTSVAAVADSARVAEIARMLSGNDSKASLEHAMELLDSATPLRRHSPGRGTGGGVIA